MNNQDYRTTRPLCNQSAEPAIFQTLNAAVQHAADEGDDLTVDLLLVAKTAMLRHYHGRR